MRFFTLLCTVSTLLPAIFAGPTPLSRGVEIEIYPGEKAEGRYIVRMEDGASKTDIIGKVTALLAGKPGELGITHQYDVVFNGFAGKFDAVTLAALQVLPGVASIAEDGVVRATDIETQGDAPWGLARLSSKTSPGNDASSLDYPYKYDSRAGTGVDIYIIDTGIRVTHDDFGGRAKWAYTAPMAGAPALQIDDNGHGTHCAGTTSGSRYGVAKRATVHAVKVLNAAGSGLNSDVVSGMDFVLKQKQQLQRPTVASMSLGGGVSDVTDDAARKMVSGGVHLVVAAGNDNQDADTTSPAHVREVITVGASNITDGRAYFSNYGPAVDVFAPGVNVISATNTGDSDTKSLSGTSMATPHVAGLVAYLISVWGDMTPAEMSQRIKDLARRDALLDIPAETVNFLVQNGMSNVHSGI